MHLTFPILQSQQSEHLLPKLSPRTKHVLEGFFKSSFILRFPFCQEVLVVSQIATAFQRIRPPLIIRSRLSSLCISACLWSMKCSCSMIPWQFFTILAKLKMNCTYEVTFVFCNGCGTFRKFFSVSCEVLVWHGFRWVARTCTTTAYQWLFLDSRPSLRILCSENRSLLVFAEVSMNTVLPFLVPPLLKHHLPNLSSLWEECASTCASRSSRLTVKGCNQTGMPCVGSSLFISFAGSRWFADHDLSSSVSRMHACHFELLLDLIMFPIFWNH